MKEYNFCNNCGKHGHLFHQCKNPITSIGIIVFNNSDELKYLMIRRKDSLGYVDFMRGKYPLFNKRYLLNIINEMTVNEKKKLLTKDFDQLWNELWGDHIGIQYRGEEKISREKFNSLKVGIKLPSNEYNLESLINECENNWNEPEWGFPKGRRNFQEKDLTCALREFEEETGCNKNSLKIIYNILPIEELFTGSNYKSYKHKYFIAFMDKEENNLKNFQKTEVSKIEWKTYSECINEIRPYNINIIFIYKWHQKMILIVKLII
jgi:8-oxo-dGTP pyrophosphatase MutT (NUDIX family)